MIQFEVKIGSWWFPLDVPTGLSLQFVKKNILYAFDVIECERSTSITFPATPANNSVFGYGNNPCTLLDRVAKRYAARLMMCGVIKSGYLYITSSDSSQYESVFVTSDLLGLQAVNELGTIDTILKGMNITADYDTPINANTSASNIWACVRYQQNGGNPYASWSLRELMSSVITNVSMPAAVSLNNISNKWRIIPKSQKPKNLFTLVTHGVSNPVTVSPFPTVDRTIIAGDSSVFLSVSAGSDPLPLGYHEESGYYFGYVNYISVLRDVTITFPTSVDSGIVMMSDIRHSASVGGAEATFLGGYSYNFTTGKFSGTPLAGREVSLTTGTKFLLCKLPAGYTTGKEGSFSYSYFSFASIGYISIRVELSVADGTRKIVSNDHVPQITIMDMFRNLAAMQGMFVDYWDGELRLVSGDSVMSDTVYMPVDDRVLGYSDVRAQFSDYVQRNIITMAEVDSVPEGVRVSNEYDVQNTNLEEEHVLRELPWSGGLQSGTLVLPDNSNDYIGVIDPDSIYLQQPRISLNTMLQRLCENRVSVQLRVRMAYYEFDRIHQYRGLLWRGMRWIWTECTWEKDIAIFSISRVA